MKSRSKELLDRAVAATVAAIEIYNKPDFLYREEAFAVLAIVALLRLVLIAPSALALEIHLQRFQQR